MNINENRMRFAFREAEKAFDEGETPIGCVIVFENKIIAKSHNQIEALKDPTAHAEIIAITSASAHLDSKVLKGCSMYVTLEPCAMCAGAIVLSKIDNLFFGAFDPKSGACGSIINITNNKSLNHKVKVSGGILDVECGNILKSFFKGKRS
jgi:tRNA(adenine34) deaminase